MIHINSVSVFEFTHRSLCVCFLGRRREAGRAPASIARPKPSRLAMNLAHTMDPRWRRNRQVASSSRTRRSSTMAPIMLSPQLGSNDVCYYHHLLLPAAHSSHTTSMRDHFGCSSSLSASMGFAPLDKKDAPTTLTHAASEVVIDAPAAHRKRRSDSLLTFAEIGNVGGGALSPGAPGTAPGAGGRGGVFVDESLGWRDGLTSVARVLALSVAKNKRKLLEDRKGPYVHLTPKRLSVTVLKSGIVAAAPLLNNAILTELDEGKAEQGLYDDDGDAVVAGLKRILKNFPWLAIRRILHSVCTVSTMRLLEWQAVSRLSLRTADKLTKNIRLSAIRKRERMTRWQATSKMAYTASKALVVQNLAIFLVDELFLIVRLAFREREKRKQNPYHRTDWAMIRKEMGASTAANAKFALSMWMAGTAGAMAGTLVHTTRGIELMISGAELGVSTVFF